MKTSYQHINYGLSNISDVSHLARKVPKRMAGVSVRQSRDVTEASQVSRDPCVTGSVSPMIKTVEFVTISCDPGYEDDLSVSSR